MLCPNLERLGSWCEEWPIWMKTGHPGSAGTLGRDPEGESAPAPQNPVATSPPLLLLWSLGVWLQVPPPLRAASPFGPAKGLD